MEGVLGCYGQKSSYPGKQKNICPSGCAKFYVGIVRNAFFSVRFFFLYFRLSLKKCEN